MEMEMKRRRLILSREMEDSAESAFHCDLKATFAWGRSLRETVSFCEYRGGPQNGCVFFFFFSFLFFICLLSSYLETEPLFKYS